jgi:hypothetical protein
MNLVNNNNNRSLLTNNVEKEKIDNQQGSYHGEIFHGREDSCWLSILSFYNRGLL